MVNDWIDAFLGFVSSIHPVWRALITGLAIALETSVLVGLVVPGDVMVLVASSAVQSWPEAIATIIAVIVGSLTGESIGYWIGRWIGPAFRRTRVARWIGIRHLDRADQVLRDRGGIAIFVSRFLPVLHSLVPLTSGMAKYPYRRFIAWTLPACLIWSCAYVTIGAVAAASYRELSSKLHIAGAVFAGIIAAGLLILWLLRRRLNALLEPRRPGGADERCKAVDSESPRACEQSLGSRNTATVDEHPGDDAGRS